MGDWEKAQGIPCPVCGEETLQVIQGRCRQCHRAMVAESEARLEDRVERRHVKSLFQRGLVSTRDLRAGRY